MMIYFERSHESGMFDRLVRDLRTYLTIVTTPQRVDVLGSSRWANMASEGFVILPIVVLQI